MRNWMTWTFVSSLALASAGAAESPQTSGHVLLTEAQMVWGEAPSALPKGAQMAVISGDPGKPGDYTLRAKLPAGYKVAPHWHSSAEHVTVISGTVAFGMGDRADDAAMTSLAAGGFAVMPAKMHHSFATRTAAVIQVHGTGPFDINYINPADDPRQAAAGK